MSHLTIQLDNLKLQLEFTELRLGASKIRIEEYTDSILSDVAKETLVESCKTIARAAGMSDGYLNSIRFEKKRFLDGNIINDYKSSRDATSVPLALFFEKGTVNHFIAPLTPDGLLSWVDDAGTRRYSKGHMVTGIKAMHIMANGVSFGLERFKNQLINKINIFLLEI